MLPLEAISTWPKQILNGWCSIDSAILYIYIYIYIYYLFCYDDIIIINNNNYLFINWPHEPHL